VIRREGLVNKWIGPRRNRRGPFHANRVIDLSYAAASRIGIAGPGSGLVEVERVFEAPEPDLSVAQTLPPPQQVIIETPVIVEESAGLWLQLGAFSSREGAENFRDKVTVKELEDLTALAEELDYNSVWTLDRIVVPEASDRVELQHSFGMMTEFPKGMPVIARGEWFQGAPLIPWLAAKTSNATSERWLAIRSKVGFEGGLSVIRMFAARIAATRRDASTRRRGGGGGTHPRRERVPRCRGVAGTVWRSPRFVPGPGPWLVEVQLASPRGRLGLFVDLLLELLPGLCGHRGPRVPCWQGHEAEFVSYRDKVTGTAESAHTGPGTVRDGSWANNKLSFTLDFKTHESIAITGTLKDGQLVGEFRTEGFVSNWEAKKKAAPKEKTSTAVKR